MKEGEQPPVLRLDAAAQVVPAADGVHGLVADDLFQDVGRRRPVDARSTRKPGLNHDENRCVKSSSSTSSTGCFFWCSNSSSRIRTSFDVPRGARFNRRMTSCRFGSAAACNSCNAAGVGFSRQTWMALSRRHASGPKSLASAIRKSRLAFLSRPSQAAKISRARATPEASPRRETRSRARATTSPRLERLDRTPRPAGGRGRRARDRRSNS